MTQHKWETPDFWQVLTGWDRPLQHFFLNIDRDCMSCGGTGTTEFEQSCKTCHGEGIEYLFNNLEDNKFPLGGMTLRQVTEELISLGIAYPPELPLTLQQEAMENTGNRVTIWHNVGGRWRANVNRG